MAPVRTNIVQEPCGLSFKELERLPEELLMAHLRAGHDDALKVLFNRYYKLVLKVALKILRDDGEAEDLMQSVFMEIYRSAGQFDPARGIPKMWILQYAYSRSLNRRQLLTRQKFYTNADISEIRESVVLPAHGTLASNEIQCLIRRSLETLNQEQRKILQLAYFEGLSLREIADSTGESYGNVRHHYYRGLNNLRTYLEDADRSVVEVRPKETADANA
jgi:RNA polymerase sigma-70 factor (ECF subfamily)